MKRREFLRNSTLASGAMLIPAFLKPLESMAAGDTGGNIKNLVIIQLSGGNDGLNTIVPYGNDIYYQKRTVIAVKQPNVIRLDDMQGLNPALAALKEFYDQGWMSIINSVGYPNPDRSHFRSMDIWQTAADSNQFLSTGWIGRFLDANCRICKPYSAIEVDDTLSIALKGEKLKGIAVENPEKLYRITSDPFLKGLAAHDDSHLSENNLGYLYKTLIDACSSAEYIHSRAGSRESQAPYPDTAFAKQLKTIAGFINAELQTRVYYVSLSGFDTHANQQNQQGRQLKIYGDGVAAFLKDLKQSGKLNDTLVMTFSEFGRRVEQNASNGTDHGTANNVMIYGGNLKKAGIYNAAPDLMQLDNGDLKYQVDFREVYATLLKKWLNTDNSLVLNKNYTGLDFV